MLPNQRKVNIEIELDFENEEVLNGLQNWLDLGLISEAKVKVICEDYLSCDLPESIILQSLTTNKKNVKVKETQIEIPTDLIKQKTKIKDKPNILVSLWIKFYQEITVKWLLFLGLFLVIASSSILAATQWDKFPDWFQYLILFSYTLTFWGISFWAKKQENLTLTSETLLAISFLLIPVNFWAIDTFVWVSSWAEWILSAIAILTLSYIYFFTTKFYQQYLTVTNFLIITYLQIGWQLKNFGWLAIYGGIISILVSLILAKNKEGIAYLFLAFITILVRGIFVERLPISELGLVIGICGWIFTQLSLFQLDKTETSSEAKLISKIFQSLGYLFLFGGWLVAFIHIKWQAVGISWLALSFFSQRLTKYWLKRDLIVIFFVAIQSYFISDSLIPQIWLANIYPWLLNITSANQYPFSVLGITIFPYLLIWVTFTGWLYKKQKLKLALLGEYFSLTILLSLTIISWINPLLKCLNLFCSTLTLIYLTYRCQPLKLVLIYLTHLWGLLTILHSIDYLFINLTQQHPTTQQWGLIFLILTVIELCLTCQQLSRENRQKMWCQSCWHFGLAVATISYGLFWYQSQFIFSPHVNHNFDSLWLLTPICLTLVASRSYDNRRHLAVGLSFVSLILMQALTISHPVMRLVSVGIATVLMVANTYYYPSELLAGINFIFAFAFLVVLLWGKISVASWFLVGAFLITLLWLLPIISQSVSISNPLIKLYVKIANGWAIVISTVELTLITIQYLLLPLFPQWQLMLASVLIALVMIIRYRKQLNYPAVYGVSWALEICLIELFLLINASRLQLASANVAVGFLALVLINKFKHYTCHRFLSVAPLVYAIMAIYLRLNFFTNYTGLITLGAAIIGICVGYFRNQGKLITYLSLAGITIAIYELVIYQIWINPDKNITDACTLLAIVSAFLAFSYRLFGWNLHRKNNIYFLNIPRLEINLIAHIHWALATLIRAMGIAFLQLFFVASEPKLTPISLIISLLLATYGILQAKDKDSLSEEEQKKNLKYNDLWVYLGVTEMFSTLIYSRFIFKQLAFLDSYSAILFVVFGLAIYQIPWGDFGWNVKPWQRVSSSIPTLMVLLTWKNISFLSLVMVALFYILIGIKQQNIRWSYFSCLLLDWAIGRWLWQNGIYDPLWFAVLVGLTFIYVAQIDPYFSSRKRHFYRLLGSGIICLFAVLFHQNIGGLLPIFISLGFIFIAIPTQIRAFLYIGTIHFCLTIFYQLIVLLFVYSFVKWLIGLAMGVSLIVIAANFEQHKDSIQQIWQDSLRKLQSWK